ncbi:DUF292 domain protein [Aspergillus glaucus CBS 516.65]|uniref:DUF292 domain protein n=1 Tax=Aspergillus glaucus CBS 516.65 TaxID=1160497 RepID=A0A1L9VUI8_ASPGL|nr:hypothetical protein ASPGLDRAFT_163828 [Aspergillus glaucus CBS 516.65]OJJ87560.1 hypothetical protein ASPGLDRAFT_163828 [Aspergillus glaucus CBS 516.65]
MPPSVQTTKLISSLRLLVPRLRLLQKKDTAFSKVQRRELAQLLEEGRDASARIRVENVISTDTAVEVMEIVELYCELLLARANVLDQVAFGEKGVRARSRAREEKVRSEVGKRQGADAGSAAKDTKSSGSNSRGLFGFPFFGGGQQKQKSEDAQPSSEFTKDEDLSPEELCYIDPAIDEAAAVVFYAWPRFPHDVRELNIVRTMLADRYGKDFMALAQENKVEHVKVPERVAKSLRVRPPTQDLVELYLKEIAKAYGISWGEEQQQEDLGNAPEFVDDRPSTPHDQQSDGENGDNPEEKTRRASDTNELNKATPPRRPVQSGKSPVSVAPPGPRTDNLNPRVKVPDPSSSGDSNNTASKSTPDTSSADNDPNRIPEVDELSRRFAELRRKP